jgi:hypothetical protein
MLHNQLKIHLPTCPYVWIDNDMKQTFNFKQTIIGYDEIIENLSNYLNDSNKINIMNFLERISDERFVTSVFSNMIFSKIIQTVSASSNRKDLRLNFHAMAYNDDIGPLIDQEYESNLSWVLLPLVGDVTTNNVAFSINTRSIKNTKTKNDNNKYNNIVKSLDPKTYKEEGKYDTLESDIKGYRTSHRYFTKRYDTIPQQKHDTTLDTNIEDNLTSNKTLINPRFQKIELNDKTRSSASVIRDRLMNSHKAQRIRNNPEMMKQLSRVDLSLNRISDSVATNDNKNYRIFEKDITNEMFDFIFENVGVRKINAIFRFMPMNSGRIYMNNNKYTHFITVVRHKKNLHVTYHEIIIN